MCLNVGRATISTFLLCFCHRCTRHWTKDRKPILKRSKVDYIPHLYLLSDCWIWYLKKWADLEYFFPFNTQLYVSGSQLALDLFGRSPVRHIDFDENLLHSLVPGAPGCLARDHATPLLKVHWHAAESPRRTGQLTVNYVTSGEVMLTVWCTGTSSPPFT